MQRFSAIVFVSILCFFSLSISAQNPIRNYEQDWKKVESFTEKGLPKSALEEVKKIYVKAKAEKQDAQLIKALIYISTLQAENREDNQVFSITELEKEIAGSREPVNSILKSYLADLYYYYYINHRYQLYNRTQTQNFNKADIATWSMEDFHKKISELYLQSIKEEKLLQQTRLEPFEAIIIKGNVRHLRPTLFDLLAHRALSYFQSTERDIKKPAYAFEINDVAAFEPASSFVRKNFTTRDSLSLEHKALLLYQKLIAFHLSDTRPDALIDVDRLRLEFVRSKSTHPDKDKLFLDAITRLANQYGSISAADQLWYMIAQWYEEKADQYKPNADTTWRYARVKAKEILERISRQKDSSEGKFNAINLLQTINTPSFTFHVEKVNLPGQPFRSLVKYRNLGSLNFRVIQLTESIKKQLENTYDDKYWKALLSAPVLRTWQQSLPVTNDLQEHGVEIKIDPLTNGEWVLLASSDKDFNNSQAILGARPFYVSTISYVNNGDNFFVLHRDNGQPLVNASVQTWVQKYDYKQSKYIKEKYMLFQTDQKGYFKLEKEKRTNNNYETNSYLVDITYNKERFFMDDMIYDYYYYRDNENEEPKLTTAIYLFTDRSLYRPAQTLFFKGIVLSRNIKEKQNSVRAGYSTTVYLRDANYKDVDSLRLTTNEFGSFNGKFQLPGSGLTGSFMIYTKTDNASAGFNVEEYKRPKFFVEYQPIRGTYKVNDNIKITGVAKAYAGNNIDGASVKYRVVRQPRFLYPWLFWRWWQPPAEPMEIAHGEAKTDKDGKFIVEFRAIPDLKIEKKFDPVFDYTVYADVTDINGETRSGEQMVSVGYKSLILVTSVAETLPVDSLNKIYVRTQNMNGEYEKADVKITVTRLKPESRLIRSRYWERPDQFVMGKQEYISYFPYDEYDNETDQKTWAKGEMVYSKTDSSRVNGEWAMVNGRFTPGFYILEFETRDKNGETVKDQKYVELIDEKNNKLNRPQYIWSVADKTTIEPGEKARVQIGTGADNLFVIQELGKGTDHNNHTETYTTLNLNNEIRSIDFSATEADRGGYGVSWLFVKHNRFYSDDKTIYVPWTNKDLSIEYASFRDKTLPGAEEKWKIKIKGYKTDEIAAEMLASMYDASLDQFYNHGWSQPYVWPGYYGRGAWNGSQNFTSVESSTRSNRAFIYKEIDKRYDYLFHEQASTSDIYLTAKTMKMAAPGRNNAPAPPERAVMQEQNERRKDGEADAVSTPDTTAGNRDNQKKPGQSGDVRIRKNFNETAFFLPDLRTDADGNIEFSFTMPEALTKWKFMALAHTKDASFGSSTKEIITQKDLMVQPNQPRFLREGDKMELLTKVVNLSEKELIGTIQLELFDAATNEPVDGAFRNMVANQYFTVGAGQSEAVKFPLEIPYQFNRALLWRIVAKSGNFSDGEENALAVLTNRMLVTETITLPMRGNGTKNFVFDKLLNSGNSQTLTNHALTLEYTSNPAWYAVQALPYLMEYPYECAEQTWNRYYANSLASYIANSSPRIKQIFDQWRIKDTAALMSNLQKNQELKAVLLEETPWVLQARSEAEQKKNIALLFDMIRMSQQLNNSYEKLKKMQSSNGGFVWFTGGPDDRYMTQYIVTGIGHLTQLKAIANGQNSKLSDILSSAIPYLDRKIKEDYDYLVQYKVDLSKSNIGYMQIQYLYMRSFFSNIPLNSSVQKAYDYYYGQAQKYWLQQSKYMQGMIALASFRKGDTKTPADILRSLKETAIVNEELGMYWKDMRRGWFWYEAPIESQALLIEAFQEAGKDTKTADDLKTWLLKNKQTNNWNTTKATAEACYALLLQGTSWLSNEPVVEVKLGNTTIRSTEYKQEAGTGYFKTIIEGKKVSPQMGNISVSVGPQSQGTSSAGVTWGAVYWQYFEDLDKITTASTPLNLVKKIFRERNTDRGPVITPVNDGDILKVGDKIKVRIELRVDRDMEYVHMKDMRAAALEPVNVLSGYKYQGGLGYYESTRDASTNFFFNYLRKGTYVFEYVLFVTNPGNFSNGITSIQCMYAPEFASHSEGIRIGVE